MAVAIGDGNISGNVKGKVYKTVKVTSYFLWFRDGAAEKRQKVELEVANFKMIDRQDLKQGNKREDAGRSVSGEDGSSRLEKKKKVKEEIWL